MTTISPIYIAHHPSNHPLVRRFIMDIAAQKLLFPSKAGAKVLLFSELRKFYHTKKQLFHQKNYAKVPNMQ